MPKWASHRLSDTDWRNMVHGCNRDISRKGCLLNPNLTWSDLIYNFPSNDLKKYWSTIEPRCFSSWGGSSSILEDNGCLFPLTNSHPSASWILLGTRTCVWWSVMATAVQKGSEFPAMMPLPLQNLFVHQLLSQDFLLFTYTLTIQELYCFLTPAFGLKISTDHLPDPRLCSTAELGWGRGEGQQRPHRGKSALVWEGDGGAGRKLRAVR